MWALKILTAFTVGVVVGLAFTNWLGWWGLPLGLVVGGLAGAGSVALIGRRT